MVLASSHLTVLVPARNAAHLLPDWLDSAGGYADAVIALDDGSTDGTRQLLESHPLVREVLTNDVRASYHGWDDLENRQRLVYAALSRRARWLLFLDADERIDAEDGCALRRFLETEARPGFAYGFQVFRMIEDHDHYDPHALWVFRLFSAIDAVQPLGSQRLHFVPVPSGIPRRRWMYTSLRIQHGGSITPVHRRARFEKYLEADPDNEYQSDYSNLLSDPAVVDKWHPRPVDLPVLLGVEGRYVDRLHDRRDEHWPTLTAVVIAQDDVAVIDRSLAALTSQTLDDDFEVIVVCSGSDGTFERVRSRYPDVRAVQLPRRALPGEARNAGLWMARGEYLSFPGSHVWLMPGSLGARVATHDAGWDMVAGSVVNGNTTRAGWASYILDHATKTPARPSGEIRGVPGSASYVTDHVRAIGGFPENVRTGEDTAVNRKLHAAGKRTYFNASVSFAHASPSTTTPHLLRHHFQRGRALGRIIRKRRDGPDFKQIRKSIDLPRRRLRTIQGALDTADADLVQAYRGRLRLLVVAGAVAAASGAWFEMLLRDSTRTLESGTPPTTASGPLLVLSGRPGEARHGLLSGGPASRAADRLMTFSLYARAVCEIRPVLSPIVTSATVTAEHMGTFTVDLPRATVDAFLTEARRVGAALALQIQPGRASLLTVLERWAELLCEPDVGVYFDVRDHVASAGQRDELEDAVRTIRRVGGDDTIVFVRGVDIPPCGVVHVVDTLDLRQPGTPFPHDALASEPRPTVLVYE